MTLTHQISWKHRLSSFAVIGTLAASMTLAAPQPAKADHPVVVAVIGAGAVVVAAAITAAAVLGAAVITGAAQVGSAAITANSNGGEGGEGGEGGGGGGENEEHGGSLSANRIAATATSQGCFATMAGGSISGSGPGTSEFLEIGQNAVPLNMQPFMSRNIKLAIEDNPNHNSLGASLEYNFDGDVMKSPSSCDYIYNSDTVTWDLTLIKNQSSANDYFLFHFDNLLLTTTEVPDTLGRSGVSFKVYQGQTEIWSWSALARQGQPSVHGPVPSFSTVTSSPGVLQIENFLEPIPVTFAANSNTTNVTVVVTYRGRGARI